MISSYSPSFQKLWHVNKTPDLADNSSTPSRSSSSYSLSYPWQEPHQQYLPPSPRLQTRTTRRRPQTTNRTRRPFSSPKRGQPPSTRPPPGPARPANTRLFLRRLRRTVELHDQLMAAVRRRPMERRHAVRRRDGLCARWADVRLQGPVLGPGAE
jgi:hypothetical protein